LRRTFAPILTVLVVAVALLSASLWLAGPPRGSRGPRVRPSRVLAGTFMEVLCRPPSDRETVDLDSRPFEEAALAQQLDSSEEAARVRQFRGLYVESLRRDAAAGDCPQIRAWVERAASVDDASRALSGLPEARRVAAVRRTFIETLGRDPLEWDDAGLRRWVDSPFTLAEIRTRLLAQRPLVGVHYFAWYRLGHDGWGNDLTKVSRGAPIPAVGSYDSSDTDVIATQIRQMEEAGIDFAIVHVIAGAPGTWANARTFVDRLSGHRLRAAVVLDGLYADDAATKRMWVEKVKAEFTGDSHYLQFHGEPLIMLYSAPLNFDVPGVVLRNVYWTDRYDPGRNTFNPNHRLEPRDWPFWAESPQPLVNGIVPVLPGYTDAALGRPRTIVHPRRDGEFYRTQWNRALSLHPELIVIYSWNEYFEQTAIEPTDAWGDRYLAMTVCYAAHARRGTSGNC